jgi:hypothetical protein
LRVRRRASELRQRHDLRARPATGRIGHYGNGSVSQGCYDDLTDSTTQAIKYIRDSGLLCTDDEERFWAMDEAQAAAETVVPLLGLRQFIDIFAGQKGSAAAW